jgi:hypothetical protein
LPLLALAALSITDAHAQRANTTTIYACSVLDRSSTQAPQTRVPLIGGTRISSGFEKRANPILEYAEMHLGVDIAAPYGTPIQVTADGVIEEARVKGTYGNYVFVRHSSTYATGYAHLAAVFAPGIRPGVRVRRGQVIAYSGNSGLSSGPHLHYEAWIKGLRVNPMCSCDASILRPSAVNSHSSERLSLRPLPTVPQRSLKTLDAPVLRESRAPPTRFSMPQQNNLLDQPTLYLSDTDYLCPRDLVEGGTLILGGLGAGKSSTSLRQLFCGLARAGFGGLICTVKSQDTDNYLADLRSCGREKDVIVFSIESGLTFDPIAYLWNTGRGAGDVESIIDFFSTLLSIGKQHIGVNNDRFWELAAEQAMRHAIHLIRLAGEPLSIVSIHRTIQSFPSRLHEHEEEAWQKRSFTASLISAIRARKETLSVSDWNDLEVATEFIFSKWASWDEKPRSSVEMTFSGLADKFMFSPYREMFCSGTYSFTPEQTTHEHKLVILDIPLLACGRETARLMQIIVKLVFQRAWLRHSYRPGCCHGAMLIQDEFQTLMSRFENHFVQVCRSSAIAPIFITQTILNLAEEMGETQPGSKTKAFLNNLSVKIAHNTTCPDTCQYMADVIGKEYRFLDSFHAGSGQNQQSHASVGGSQQLVHIVEPIAFTRLVKPDSNNKLAQALVYVSGKHFNATKTAQNPTGRNYLSVYFSRE